MNVNAILEELSNLNPPNRSFDNSQMIKALSLINNPQYSYKVIHIAGTNGKGSTASFIEAGLIGAAYKVGKFSSPYIHVINECITINTKMIADDSLANLYSQYKETLLSNGIYLSSFEMLTFLMFVYCEHHKIDYLVLETGLGGKDDSTNVVDSAFSIITNISLEHMQFLGNTLESIAKHKAGIIKDGYTVLGDSSAELINEVALRSNNFISIRDKYHIVHVELNQKEFTTDLHFIDSLGVDYKVQLGLFGYFQVYNFLCAYEVLNKIGINWDVIKNTVKNVRWSGRLEKINDKPLTIADASHNSDGVRNLASSLVEWFPFERSVIICSILIDKDQEEMINYYSKISANIIFCAIPSQSRTSDANSLALLASGKFKNIWAFDTPDTAYQFAKSLRYDAILVTGSCYLLKHFI